MNCDIVYTFTECSLEEAFAFDSQTVVYCTKLGSGDVNKFTTFKCLEVKRLIIIFNSQRLFSMATVRSLQVCI